VEISSAADISVSSVHGVKTYSAPTSLKLFKTFEISDDRSSVCSYEGNTYVVLQGNSDGIFRIDKKFNVTELVTSVGRARAVAVAVYKDKLYALTQSSVPSSRGRITISKIQYQVRVYTLYGNEVTSWRHGDESETQNRLTVIDDQVVIPDRSNASITVYSLAGKVVKHIPCSLLSENSTAAICAADRHCVVVSVFSQVFKLDLTTEKVIWTCKDVANPQGVTCYRSKYILVTNYSSKTTIWILDVKTGQ